ncbi:MAG: response regulator [Candidatus Omnitrophica bacterium]|nr:response regulator [Candidatus Omnitrophota bacterium]
MSRRVLIVDDAPITRLMIKDILEFHGYKVVAEANNGREGVDKYRELKPDVVTMDIVMKEKDGIAALKEILAIDRKAKVVMISAIDQRELLMDAIRSGATDYIVKPFEHERVISAIKKALGET